MRLDLDDAQEVYVACPRPGGALEAAGSRRGFRFFLYGMAPPTCVVSAASSDLHVALLLAAFVLHPGILRAPVRYTNGT